MAWTIMVSTLSGLNFSLYLDKLENRSTNTLVGGNDINWTHSNTFYATKCLSGSDEC